MLGDILQTPEVVNLTIATFKKGAFHQRRTKVAIKCGTVIFFYCFLRLSATQTIPRAKHHS